MPARMPSAPARRRLLPRNARVFITVLAVLGLAAIASSLEVHLPGNHRGYAPEQPVAFSHRLHAGELGVDCLYCHYAARRSRTAGIPPAGLCMNCHGMVTASWDVLRAERDLAAKEARPPKRVFSAEIRKLYDALGLDDEAKPKPGAKRPGIAWHRVHNLPDFVFFDHRSHVAGGLACQTCHGPVQTLDRMRQDADLSMGWCLDCHRSQSGPVSTDCSTCHF